MYTIKGHKAGIGNSITHYSVTIPHPTKKGYLLVLGYVEPRTNDWDRDEALAEGEKIPFRKWFVAKPLRNNGEYITDPDFFHTQKAFRTKDEAAQALVQWNQDHPQ